MQPFVKWAGGKRQLLPELKKRMPKEFNNYFEPFVGGGALLLELQPKDATIGDVNSILVETYNIIKNDVLALTNELDNLEYEHQIAKDKSDYYYEKRKEFNELISNSILSVKTCSLFIYLNKACFNGLFRVNSKGLFNVPFNQKEVVKTYDEVNMKELSSYLKNVSVLNEDFEVTCKKAKQGDFVFFDSPYAPIKDDSFESYTKEGFSKDEHIRLANLFRTLSDKGVYCMLTNHNTEFIEDLYKEYNIDIVSVKRMINRNANDRVGTEVIITNYEIDKDE